MRIKTHEQIGGAITTVLAIVSPRLTGYAIGLYFRFHLSPRMVEEVLAARGISSTYETIRQWGRIRA